LFLLLMNPLLSATGAFHLIPGSFSFTRTYAKGLPFYTSSANCQGD